jgi:hypothetical protein
MLWALIALAMPVARPAAAQAARQDSTLILPGMSVERGFGTLTLAVRVDERVARVEVGVLLDGRVMGVMALVPGQSAGALDYADGPSSVRGSAAVRFAPPGGRSALVGDFVVRQGRGQTLFRGEVVAWVPPPALVLKRATVWVTPELRVETDVLWDAAQPVQVRFRTGSLTLATLTLAQGADSAVVDRSFASGAVRIDSGMVLVFQPATPTQEGQVYLRGTFASSNLPRVEFAGAVATWPYVRPP